LKDWQALVTKLENGDFVVPWLVFKFVNQMRLFSGDCENENLTTFLLKTTLKYFTLNQKTKNPTA
jgi:hypothetical protein